MGARAECVKGRTRLLFGEKAKIVGEQLRRFPAVKKIGFRKNREMSADRWAALLAGLAPTVEDFNFR